jgi:SAM-dependent methyltransferase
MTHRSEVYKYPEYYALGYRWNTEAECDFIQAYLKSHGPAEARRLLDIGCGSGRHMAELAARGYDLTGIDLSEEMVEFVNAHAAREDLAMKADTGDLRRLRIDGTYDAAYCFMDTFRFLLTNEEIIAHLKTVAAHLASGGLYLVDFWIPRNWETMSSEIHQWEQTEGETTVRVFYLQHPESVDPIAQTFEDELVFEVHEGEAVKEIKGGRTRTRLIMPQEFQALVEASGVFNLVGLHGEFDAAKPLDQASLSWRMISVLKAR